ncbi:MAG TPA: hypothetical protein VD766_05645 [Solirubrobacterales bacterium]|nr:hypothetical protein [Solirubrobacterales bacterium]
MENRKVPALIALAGIIIALVVFFFVIDEDTGDQEREATVSEETTEPTDGTSGGGDEPEKPEKPEAPEEPDVPELEIRNGEPVGGPLELEVPQGEGFELLVTTDTADELHLHGYELYFDIEPGKSNEIKVPATDIGTGIVELESHSTGVVLAEISVVP